MLYGGVTYRLKADPENDVYVPWAGRVVFTPQEKDLGIKMQFYQVYLVRFLPVTLITLPFLDKNADFYRIHRLKVVENNFKQFSFFLLEGRNFQIKNSE